MAVRTIYRDSRSELRTRGRLYTREKAKPKRQRVGRVSGFMMAGGGVFTAFFLAPTFLVPLLFMAFFILIGGFVMDETATARWLAVRLLGPVLALAGVGLVVWLMAAGVL